MRILSWIVPNYQKALVDRLVKERDEIRDKKHANELHQEKVRNHRKEMAQQRELDIEKEATIKLQNELLDEIDTYRDIEELFAFKIHKIYQISSALKKVVKLSESFMVASAELQSALEILMSPNESQERIDKLISEKSLAYISRRAKSAKTSDELLDKKV
jgi:hypothetical protein